MILLDTNIFIEIFRNNTHIISKVNGIGQNNIAVSDVTFAELYFGARNKNELQLIHGALSYLPAYHVVAEISQKAVELVKKYCLSHKLDWEDALIAATAIYHNCELYTLNLKDFSFLPDLKIYK